MPYNSGTWGPEAQERSKTRLEYFREYNRRKYLARTEEFKQRSKEQYWREGRREQMKEEYWNWGKREHLKEEYYHGGKRELMKEDYQKKKELKKQKTG